MPAFIALLVRLKYSTASRALVMGHVLESVELNILPGGPDVQHCMAKCVA